GRAQMGVISSHIMAMLIYAIGAAISLLLLEQQSNSWLVVLHLVGALVFYLLWVQQSPRELRFQSFGAVLLLSCAVLRLINAIDAAVNGAGLAEWRSFVYGSTADPEWNIFWAETLTVVGFLCVSASWQRVVVGKGINLSIFAKGTASTSTLVFMYVCSVASDVASRIYGLQFGGLEQFIAALHLAGIAAIFGIVLNIRSTVMRIGLAALLGLPLAYLGAGTGMKENIILPLLPSAYFAWAIFSSRLVKILLLLVGFAVLCVLQVFVQIVRDRVWSKGQDLSTDQVIEIFMDSTDLETLF